MAPTNFRNLSRSCGNSERSLCILSALNGRDPDPASPVIDDPAIVEKDGRAVFVIGSPGGPRIITAVLETLMNLVDFGMDPNAAVAASRFHQQYLPDTVFYETAGVL